MFHFSREVRPGKCLYYSGLLFASLHFSPHLKQIVGLSDLIVLVDQVLGAPRAWWRYKRMLVISWSLQPGWGGPEPCGWWTEEQVKSGRGSLQWASHVRSTHKRMSQGIDRNGNPELRERLQLWGAVSKPGVVAWESVIRKVSDHWYYSHREVKGAVIESLDLIGPRVNVSFYFGVITLISHTLVLNAHLFLKSLTVEIS